MRTSIRMLGFAGLAMGIAMTPETAWAQRTGGSPPAGGAVGSGGSHLPPNMNGQPTGPVPGTLNGSIYLTGNVMLDDGTPPPDPVTIERVCNGAPRAQGYTDAKGRFSFQIGQTAGVMQDASEEASGLPGTSNTATGLPSGVGPAQSQQPNAPDTLLANCDLRAVLSGFRSDTVSLGLRRLMDDPSVGTIVLHRLANVEGSAISVTSLLAPKEARRMYNKALQYLRKDQEAEAGKALRKAVDIYPNYAAAWYELGRIQERDGGAEQALQSYANAISADAKFISPCLRVAEIRAKAGNWVELARITGRLLKLDAVDYPMAYVYNATANLNLGQLDDAEKSAAAGAKLDTPHRYPKLEQLLAAILARKSDYAEAAVHLRKYLAMAPDAADAGLMKKELGELERRSGASDQAKAAAGAS